MRPDSAPTPQMEKPPEFSRRVELSFQQKIGLGLLLCLPVLALFRLMGDGEQTVKAEGAGITLEVVAPKSARYGNATRMELKLSGGAALAGQSVTLTIARDYLARFNEVRARPEMTRWTDAGGVIVQELPSKESLPILIELTPEKHGWAGGTVVAAVGSGPAIEVKFKTFIFP